MTRPTLDATLAITFLYYRDLPAAQRFYEDVLGLSVMIDQGWCKFMGLNDKACVGLVDETRGMNSWQAQKCVQLCLRVPDVDAWRAWIEIQGVESLSDMFVSEELGIRAFVFNDPEGYQVEFQTPTRPGA